MRILVVMNVINGIALSLIPENLKAIPYAIINGKKSAYSAIGPLLRIENPVKSAATKALRQTLLGLRKKRNNSCCWNSTNDNCSLWKKVL